MEYCFYIFVLLNFALLASPKEFTADFVPRSNRAPRSAQDNVLTPLRLQITSKISSRFANTLVTSTMENNSSRSKEARFAVHLPETAFISNFSMVVDGNVYVGMVKEKSVATAEYSKAKNNSLNTGLVSQSSKGSIRGMDTFEIAFNVAPQSAAEFRLNYQQLLERKKGYYEQVISVRPKLIIPLLEVVVDIDEPQSLSFVDVMKIRNDPSDKVELGNPLVTVHNNSQKSVHIEYSPSEEDQRRLGANGIFGDFIVRYDVSHGSDAGVLQVLDSYFVHFFSPGGLNPLAKDVVFVIDISGSMSGTKITQTREAMRAMLDQLRSDDLFNIVLFNGKVHPWKSRASLTNGATVSEAKDFVNTHVNARGSTNINGALSYALNLLTGTSNVPIVLFLTDGQPTAGETNPLNIRANVASANKIGASIFALGFGFNLDFDFLLALSAENGGNARRIYPEKDAASQLKGIFDEISSPLLQKIDFQYPKELVDEAYTTAVSFDRYFNGSELVVSGKLKTTALSQLMTVAITGHAGKVPVTYSLSQAVSDLTVPPNQVVIKDFTERLWAYKKIKELLVQLLVSKYENEKIRLKSRALNLSLKYNFVTPLTSIVVVQSQVYLQDNVLVERAMNGITYYGSAAKWSHFSAGWLLFFPSSFLLMQFCMN